MLVSDVMTTNVITVSSDTLMVEAGKIMEFHHLERLPVVDRGKLVGIVTKNRLLRNYPSQATSLSHWELHYLLAKIRVGDIMKREVVTVTPDTTVERAIAIAQSNRVGSLPVLEDGRLVGIVTTNDIFYKILNPLMGIGEKGIRVIVYGAGEAGQAQKVMECLSRKGIKVKSFCTLASSKVEGNDLVVHLDTEEAGPVLEELKKLGLSADVRAYQP